jgi:hypothetical protein
MVVALVPQVKMQMEQEVVAVHPTLLEDKISQVMPLCQILLGVI